jgi:hypothetical protein
MPLRLVGVKEACSILHCNPDQLWQLRQREDFPQAVAELSAGHVWHRRDIEAFARKINREHHRRHGMASAA